MRDWFILFQRFVLSIARCFTNLQHSFQVLKVLRRIGSHFHHFAARRYASAVARHMLSSCVSVRLLQASIVPKWLDIGSLKQCYTVAQGLETETADEQAGFQQRRGTSGQIMNLRILMHKTREHQQPLCMFFVDFKKAFDSISHDKLWVTMMHRVPRINISQPQTAFRSVQPFLRTPQQTLNAFQWDGQPLNLPISLGGSEQSSNIWLLGPTQVSPPNGISISLAVFAGLTNVTNKQTDRPHYTVCSNRSHLMHWVHVMWLDNVDIVLPWRTKPCCYLSAAIFNSSASIMKIAPKPACCAARDWSTSLCL